MTKRSTPIRPRTQTDWRKWLDHGCPGKIDLEQVQAMISMLFSV